MRRVSLSPQRKPVWCGAPGAGCATLMCSCCLSGRPGEDGCRPNGFGEDLEHGRGTQGILWAVPTDDVQGGARQGCSNRTIPVTFSTIALTARMLNRANRVGFLLI